MAEYNFNDIDEILTSPADESSSSSKNIPTKNSLKTKGIVNTTQALNSEGKGKYYGIPLAATAVGISAKARWDKKYLESLQELRRMQEGERALLAQTWGGASEQAIRKVGGATITPTQTFLGGGQNTLSEMTNADIVRLARTDATRKTVFAGSSLKGAKYPQIVVDNFEGVKKFMDKGGQLVESVTPEAVKPVLGRAGKYLGRAVVAGTGIADAEKLFLRTPDVYNYHTETLRKGIDPNQSTEYMGVNVPNYLLTNVVAPAYGGLKAIQNVGEVVRDLATAKNILNNSYLIREQLAPFLFDKSDDKQKVLTDELIKQYTDKGMNPLEAERVAKNYVKVNYPEQFKEKGKTEKDASKVYKSLVDTARMAIDATYVPEE